MVGFTTDPRAARSSYHCNRATIAEQMELRSFSIGLTLSFYLVHIDLILASSSFWCWNVNHARLQTNGFWSIYFLCFFQARMWPKWTMPLSFTSMLMMPGSQFSIPIHCSCCHIQFAVTSENPTTGENPKKSIYIYIWNMIFAPMEQHQSIGMVGKLLPTSCVWTGRSVFFSVIGKNDSHRRSTNSESCFRWMLYSSFPTWQQNIARPSGRCCGGGLETGICLK